MVEDRNINKQSIYDCLVEKGVSGILEQRINRFKLFYKQNGSRVNYDLIIVIDFEDSKEKNIKVVTI